MSHKKRKSLIKIGQKIPDTTVSRLKKLGEDYVNKRLAICRKAPIHNQND